MFIREWSLQDSNSTWLCDYPTFFQLGFGVFHLCFPSALPLTAMLRLFPMTGQVWRVTLGGIQPAVVPPPVLCSCAVKVACTLRPARQVESGTLLSTSFPPPLRPPMGLVPTSACSSVFVPCTLYQVWRVSGCSTEDSEHVLGSSAVFRL